MQYRYSQVDRKNLAWFEKDTSRATLLAIKVKKGNIRGLQKADFQFRYPLTAISGRNGTGKTTALALAACAYHNDADGHNPLNRKYPYYTFSDFFIQSQDESPLEGVEILYEILYDNWNRSERMPTGVGRGWQKRWKRMGGKWNNYDLRVDRNVIFYGIERIVPHAERSVYRSYRRRFRETSIFYWEDEVKECVSRVLGKPYKRLWHRSYSGYRLPMLESGSKVHSGFNLGAGENALINVFSGILSCDKSLLVVIDELELGLHEEAQRRLVSELKNLAESRHIQLIFTTHSPAVLRELPPEARLFIESGSGDTHIVEGISTEYAAGRLAGRPNAELDILVEDDVAASIVRQSLDQELRYRTSILSIGSPAAIIRNMAGRRRSHASKDVIAILDGDMATNSELYVNLFINALESTKEPEKDKDWLLRRLSFLPGEAWPERWLITTVLSVAGDVAEAFDTTIKKAKEMLECSLLEDRHQEFSVLAERLACDEKYLRERLASIAVATDNDARDMLRMFILEVMNNTST